MSATTIRIDLLRHGETAGSGRYCGSTDDTLTPRGREQMRSALGEDCPWERVISSPLTRCAAFARELAQRRGLPFEIENRLREYHFGAWEGKSATELLTTDPKGIARFWKDPVRYPPPGSEDISHFQARVLEAWGELLARHAGKYLLIICHGGPIRIILGQVQGMSLPERLRLEVPHASLSRVRIQTAAAGRDQTATVVAAGP